MGNIRIQQQHPDIPEWPPSFSFPGNEGDYSRGSHHHPLTRHSGAGGGSLFQQLERRHYCFETTPPPPTFNAKRQSGGKKSKQQTEAGERERARERLFSPISVCLFAGEVIEQREGEKFVIKTLDWRVGGRMDVIMSGRRRRRKPKRLKERERYS